MTSRQRPTVAGAKLHGAGACPAKSAGIVMTLTVAGFVAGGTRIDTAEAVDVSDPRFFQQMAGGEDERGVKGLSAMKKFEIEHIGISVKEPIKMANWYQETLGFDIKFWAEDDEKAVAFITDGGDRTMLELGKLPDVLPLAEGLSHHLQLHIALKSDDPDKDAEFLVSKGARFIEKCPITRQGENLIVLSDPWGNTLQLAKRKAD